MQLGLHAVWRKSKLLKQLDETWKCTTSARIPKSTAVQKGPKIRTLGQQATQLLPKVNGPTCSWKLGAVRRHPCWLGSGQLLQHKITWPLTPKDPMACQRPFRRPSRDPFHL